MAWLAVCLQAHTRLETAQGLDCPDQVVGFPSLPCSERSAGQVRMGLLCAWLRFEIDVRVGRWVGTRCAELGTKPFSS